jgi:AbrB family looped-hinge helix DNA binding protein
MTLVKVSSNGQLAIPAEILVRARLRPGDTIQLEVDGVGDIHLRRQHRLTFKEMFEEDLVDRPVPWEVLIKGAEQAEADKVLAGGGFETCDDVDAFLADLEMEAGAPPE